MRVPRPARYDRTARWYDLLSLERPVYRTGRVTGIGLLHLRPGDRVLDVGCGTGLDLPLLAGAVGPAGSVVAVDRSEPMLARARTRVRVSGLPGVDLREADAADLGAVTAADPPFDAALFTYALSIIGPWRQVLDTAIARVRPGGRVAVVDLGLPTGRWRPLSPLARLACLAGGADPHRHPWERLAELTTVSTHCILRGGHVHVVAGTVAPAGGDPDDPGGRPTGTGTGDPTT